MRSAQALLADRTAGQLREASLEVVSQSLALVRVCATSCINKILKDNACTGVDPAEASFLTTGPMADLAGTETPPPASGEARDALLVELEVANCPAAGVDAEAEAVARGIEHAMDPFRSKVL